MNLILLLGIYTVLGSVPYVDISFNYISWFGVIFILSSYIRLYPNPLFERKKLWRTLSILFIVLSIISVIVLQLEFHKKEEFFISDSNKILAVAVALSTFLWVKNINIPYNKVINSIGTSTFGVLLIHANSEAMRQWLWEDTVDCVSHYSLPLWNLIAFSFGIVLLIFVVCICIDKVRIRLIEKPFFRWYDKRYDPHTSFKEVVYAFLTKCFG